MNRRSITIFFLIPILAVAAVAIQDAFAGCVECGGVFPPFGNPPTMTTFEPSRGSEGGVPIVYYGEPLTVSVDLTGVCVPSGIASASLHLGPFDDGGGDGEFAAFILPMAYAIGDEITVLLRPSPGSPPNTFFDGVFGPLEPSHGLASISYWITCNDGTMEQKSDGSVYVDPSGQVFNQCTGQPIQGATVTLLRDNDFDNDFEHPPLAAHVPGINPESSAADGAYGWMVEPFFFYKVKVEATGFVTQESTSLFIPPEVVGLDFFLVPENGCPAGIGGKIIPLDTTSLLLAGAQSSLAWILPLVLGSVGLAVFILRRS